MQNSNAMFSRLDSKFQLFTKHFNVIRFVALFQVAVIKNRWLAKRFGEQEDTFPVVFQFERKTAS
jgi:hypothetical protein